MVIRRPVSFAASLLVLLSSVVAAAQDRRPARPYRGLFGPDARDAKQVLSVNGQMGIGYDTDVIAEQREHGLGTTTTSFLRTSDIFRLYSGGVSYADHGERYDFGASLSSVARDYSRFATVSSHAASVGGILRLGRRTILTGSQTATYEPLGILFRFPTLTDPGTGQVQPTGQDFGVLHGSYFTYSTGATAAQQLTRRSSLLATYSYQNANVSGLNGGFRSQAGFLRYSHKFTRDAGWHVGYGYTEARYFGAQEVYRGDTLDGGIDYTRDLSVTRRTHLSFSTGLMSIREHQYTRYQVTGTGVLNHEIGRTWLAAIVYTRSVAFFETTRTPYFYDGVSIGLSGLISQRLGFHSSAGATFGDVTVVSASPGSNRFTTGYGNAGLVFGLSRYAAIAGDYVVYGYSLDDASVITGGLLRPQLSRHSVTVSLRAWAPIVERGRRSNAAR